MVSRMQLFAEEVAGLSAEFDTFSVGKQCLIRSRAPIAASIAMFVTRIIVRTNRIPSRFAHTNACRNIAFRIKALMQPI